MRSIIIKQKNLTWLHPYPHNSVCHGAFAGDGGLHKADEVSEVRLVGQIDAELDEVSQVREADELNEDCEVNQADE